MVEGPLMEGGVIRLFLYSGPIELLFIPASAS